MTRSLWKNFYVDISIFKKVQAFNANNTKYKFKTWSRNTVVIPEMVNMKLEIHNGNKFISITVRKEMVGYKLGEFVFTRKRVVHKDKRKVKKK